MFPNLNRVGMMSLVNGGSGSFAEIPLPADYFDIEDETGDALITEVASINIVIEGA